MVQEFTRNYFSNSSIPHDIDTGNFDLSKLWISWPCFICSPGTLVKLAKWWHSTGTGDQHFSTVASGKLEFLLWGSQSQETLFRRIKKELHILLVSFESHLASFPQFFGWSNYKSSQMEEKGSSVKEFVVMSKNWHWSNERKMGSTTEDALMTKWKIYHWPNAKIKNRINYLLWKSIWYLYQVENTVMKTKHREAKYHLV